MCGTRRPGDYPCLHFATTSGSLLAAVAPPSCRRCVRSSDLHGRVEGKTLNGLPSQGRDRAHDGILVVKVTNNGTAKCAADVRMTLQPQTAWSRLPVRDPGKTEQDAFQAQRRWTSVAVEVT